ncbi:protein-associating with the carboxyl-terminal domain of ezrin-like isoform X2 [Watersipora subatra]|uniref:protein-associating with the carboxyl-terminal domain of ezrin-like isoform X2 n=1 Tax=Watersipora subatra TaxID=2589382 RepID=UPI00355B1E00
MGSGQSSDIQEDQFDELLFERGDDSLAVQVHSAELENEIVTVFTYTSDRDHRPVAINTMQSHKVLRHPNILKLVTCTEPAHTCHVVTEPATPLSVCLEYVNRWEITVGLVKILQVLDFLHKTAGFSHNNISLESIYVTPDGSWKLARLDCARKQAANTSDYISLIHVLRDSNIYTGQRSTKTLPPSHCRDINGLGRVCEVLLDHLGDFEEDLLTQFTDIIDAMQSTDPSQVPTAAEVIAQPLLSNPLVTTLQFIEDIAVKTTKERTKFFSSLVGRLRELPEEVIAKVLVKPLLKRFVVENEEACAYVIPVLLTPKLSDEAEGLLSPPLFSKYVAPVLYKLFTVREHNVRILLLRHFGTYCSLLDVTDLEHYVMPMVLQGLHDIDDSIVALSLRALADLVPVLGGEVVIGTERQEMFVSAGKVKTSVEPDEPLLPKAEEVPPEPALVDPPKGRPKRPLRKPREPRVRHQERPKLGVKKMDVERRLSTSSKGSSNCFEEPVDGLRESLSDVQTRSNNIETAHGAALSESLPGSPVRSTSQVLAEEEEEEEEEEVESSPVPSEFLTTEDDNSDWETPVSPPKSVASQPTPNHKRDQDTIKPLSLHSVSKVTKKETKINRDFSKLDIKTGSGKEVEEIDFFAGMTPTLGTQKASVQSTNMAEETSSSKSTNKSAINLAHALADSSEIKNGWDEDDWSGW